MLQELGQRSQASTSGTSGCLKEDLQHPSEGSGIRVMGRVCVVFNQNKDLTLSDMSTTGDRHL